MTDTPSDPFAKASVPPLPPSGPPPQYPPPGPAPWNPPGARRPEPPAAAPVLTLAGLAVLVTGLFVLPLNSYADAQADVGFLQTRTIVSALTDSGLGAYSPLARAWWSWAAFVVGAILVVLLGLAIARVAPLATGSALTLVALVGGVLHTFAMAGSDDYLSLQKSFGRGGDNFFDHPGTGVWVSLVGFAIVLAGGVVVAVTGRR